MRWITENPWPLMLMLLAASIVSGILLPRRGYLIGTALLGAALLVWFVENQIVTAGERVELELQAVLEGFRQRDLNAINRRISDTTPELRKVAAAGLELVRLHAGFHMTDVSVTVSDDGQEAVAELRANGPVTLLEHQLDSQVSTRWRVTLQLQQGSWRIFQVHRLDVISGEDMGILDAG